MDDDLDPGQAGGQAPEYAGLGRVGMDDLRPDALEKAGQLDQSPYIPADADLTAQRRDDEQTIIPGQAASEHAAGTAEQVHVKTQRIEMLGGINRIELGSAQFQLGDQMDHPDQVAFHPGPTCPAAACAIWISSAMEL